ncbi:putative membrane protein [Acinetobacter sp. 809848]|nr:putative membrane protein [Acinetobacter sp. 809848]
MCCFLLAKFFIFLKFSPIFYFFEYFLKIIKLIFIRKK